MAMRVGFILGKEYDHVDVPGSLVDTSFLHDIPEALRKRPEKSRCPVLGMNVDSKDLISADLAIAWYVKKHHPELAVDCILCTELTLERLESNDINFIVGTDLSDYWIEGAEEYLNVERAFRHCGNIMPSWDVQESVYMKSIYMKKAMEIGVPVAPTVFAYKESRTPEMLLEQIQSRGWKRFILKQSYAAYSIGVRKMDVEDCVANPQKLRDYFDEFPECPEYVVQEFIEGFTRNWEVRCFWFNGEFLYAIGNRAAVSQAEGENVGIITEEEIPAHFLKRAKEIGKQALGALPQDGTLTCIRTDIGCSDSHIYDHSCQHWNEVDEFFFLNEIEQSATTYFARILKFDCIPTWANFYANKAKDFKEKMHKELPEAVLKSGYAVTKTSTDTCSTADTLPACPSGFPVYNESDGSSDERDIAC